MPTTPTRKEVLAYVALGGAAAFAWTAGNAYLRTRRLKGGIDDLQRQAQRPEYQNTKTPEGATVQHSLTMANVNHGLAEQSTQRYAIAAATLGLGALYFLRT